MSKLHTDRSEEGVEPGTFICADDQLAVWQLLFYDLWKYKDVGDGWWLFKLSFNYLRACVSVVIIFNIEALINAVLLLFTVRV